MDEADLVPLLEDLSGDIDGLTRALQPLLDAPLPTIASKVPLLDKAKLHILATYAIESLLFSSLRISGVDARDHPVFRELARTRQYFEKAKTVEDGPQKRTMEVDKAAAGRFVKAGLAGNERSDRPRASEREKQGTSAKRKLDGVGAGGVEGAPQVGRAAMLAKRGKWMTVGDEGEGAAAGPTSGEGGPSDSQQAPANEVETQPRSKNHKSPKTRRNHQQKSSKAPKSGHEAFQSLMRGSREGG